MNSLLLERLVGLLKSCRLDFLAFVTRSISDRPAQTIRVKLSAKLGVNLTGKTESSFTSGLVVDGRENLFETAEMARVLHHDIRVSVENEHVEFCRLRLKATSSQEPKA